jgi:hypothetical protein
VHTANPTVAWTTHADSPWITGFGDGSVRTGDGEITISADSRDLARGVLTGHLLFSTPGGQFRVVEVHVTNGSETNAQPAWKRYR